MGHASLPFSLLVFVLHSFKMEHLRRERVNFSLKFQVIMNNVGKSWQRNLMQLNHITPAVKSREIWHLLSQ